MSTRCNVIIKDECGDQLFFYRHSDGYPSGVAKTLGEFVHLIKTDRIRDNLSQSAGWLILLGYEEYSSYNDLKRMRDNKNGTGIDGWKVGAYEPCSGLMGWIEYLYEIDLSDKVIRCLNLDGKGVDLETTEELTAELRKLGYAND